MRIIFLGTNGWYDTKTGNTPCVLIETKAHYIILDAGDGIYKIDRFITADKPIFLFLSHFHLDHISGLHILNKFSFKQTFHIYGQKGTKEILKRIICHPYTIPFEKLLFKVKFHELAEGIHPIRQKMSNGVNKILFSVVCRKLLHADPCFGYRFELEGKIITFCTDTGICPNLLKLAKNADLLISECSLKPGVHMPEWPHLNPEQAALLAKKVKAKRLALFHFDADQYKSLKERKSAEIIAKKIFKNIIIAQDGMEVKL